MLALFVALNCAGAIWSLPLRPALFAVSLARLLAEAVQRMMTVLLPNLW